MQNLRTDAEALTKVEVLLSETELAGLDAYIALHGERPMSRPEAVREIIAATLAFSLTI